MDKQRAFQRVRELKISTSLLQDLSFQSVSSLVLRRWKLLILATLAVMIPVGLALYAAAPLYTSEAKLAFDSRYHTVETDLLATLEGRPQDEASVLGEIEVIRSRSLAEKVIRQLGLERDPEFNQKLRPPGGLWWAWDNIVSTVSQLLGGEGEDRSGRNASSQEMIDLFQSRLKVTQVPDTRVITLRFTSDNPNKAAKILNTIGEIFLLSRLQDRLDTSQWISQWLAEKVQTLRVQVEEAESKIAEYRKAHGLFAGERAAFLNEQISELGMQLAEASSATKQAAARLEQARRLVRRGGNLPEPLRLDNSPLIDNLRQRQIELQGKIAELEDNYGRRHPIFQQARAEYDKVERELRTEIDRFTDRLEYEVRVTSAREDALREDLRTAKGEVATADQHGVGLRALEREAEASRLTLERFTSQLLQITSQENLQALFPSVRIISTAFVPEKSSYPRIIPTLVLAFLAALGIGVVCALIADHYVSHSFVSAEEIEGITGIPVMAHIPLVPDPHKIENNSAFWENPLSPYWEAIGAMYTRILLANQNLAGTPPKQIKVIVFLSSEAHEGKSMTALSLARQQAWAGRRVLLLDTDFRLSRISRLTDVTEVSGLSEFLNGLEEIAGVIREDLRSPLHVIPAGKTSVDHFNLVESELLTRLLTGLRDQYDLVIIDTMPLMAMAHAHVFAEFADASILMVRWGRTRQRVVMYAIKQLEFLGCSLSGIALSMVDTKKNSLYSYGDSLYYSGDAVRYYQNKQLREPRE